jgi:uracil-DNA glycosylase family 4
MTCDRCPLAPLNNFKCVSPRGNIDGKIFFVGEAPGYKEFKIGSTFVGKAGMFLQFYLQSFGLAQFAYLTNAVKCRPPNNRTPLPIELSTCRPKLLAEIEKGKPSIIVLLGNTAINQYFNAPINAVSKLANKVIVHDNKVIVFAYHPSYIMRNGDYDNYNKLFLLLRLLYIHLVNKYI